MAALARRKDDLASVLMAGFEIAVMDEHFVRVILSVNFEDSSQNGHS